jgi:hypothetical protein
MPARSNAMLVATTTTTSHPAAWAIDDEVIHLREWATDTVHPLIWDARNPPKLGTAAACSIRVRASSQRVAREHAYLERSRGRWSVMARGSEHELLVDGAKRESAELRPGVEISLGGAITLIAESPRWIALREALSRLLGWSQARRATVDLALRIVREHDLQRQPLILRGGRHERDLVPVAAELHRLTLTEERPFILYDPHRDTTETAEAPVQTIADRASALAEAKDGTLCLLHSKLKYRELTTIYAAVLPRDCLTHIVLCTVGDKAKKLTPAPIVIPPLDHRKTEIDRLINEYVVEAAKRLYCTKPVRLSSEDRAWLRTQTYDSLAEIQTSTLRLVAVREAGTVNAGSALLGISHVALTKWLNSRGFAKLEAARARKFKRARATTYAPSRRGTSKDR